MQWHRDFWLWDVELGKKVIFSRQIFPNLGGVIKQFTTKEPFWISIKSCVIACILIWWFTPENFRLIWYSLFEKSLPPFCQILQVGHLDLVTMVTGSSLMFQDMFSFIILDSSNYSEKKLDDLNAICRKKLRRDCAPLIKWAVNYPATSSSSRDMEYWSKQ